MTATLFIAFFVLAFINVPIAISLLAATAIPLISFTDLALPVIVQRYFYSLNSFSLMSIPFFVLAGNFLAEGGVSRRLVNLAKSLVGWIPGGLAVVCFVASAFFGAISGSSSATVVAIGSIMVPALLEAGYSLKFSLATVASAGYLGIIIPPSIPMVTYGLATGESVGDLFLCGFIPGILLVVFMSVYGIYYGKKNVPVVEKFSIRKFLRALVDSLWALGMPIIILGGIYSGVFTPTESAAVACVYGIIVGRYVYKELTWKGILEIFRKSFSSSATIMFIVAAAGAFGWLMTWANLPAQIGSFIVSISPNKFVFLLLVNVLLLFVGVFMDTNAAILILAPIFMPVLAVYNINPLHFGIVMIVNLAIGLLTPPLGLNLYIAAGLKNVKPDMVINKHLLAYIILSIAALLLLTYIPDIALCLPKLLS